MIRFILVLNKQGQARIMRYYDNTELNRRKPQEAEIMKRILTRSDRHTQCNFFDFKNFRVVYKKYGTLFFVVGIDDDENELAVLEFIHNIVETLDKYFNKVSEMDIMFNVDRTYMILDEMIQKGRIIESNKSKILGPLYTMDHVINNS